MNIQLPDVTLAYTLEGQGIPLIFIHGFPLTRRMWQPQVAGLKQAARILAPDLRGHGESQPAPGPYSMELFADDLNALLDALHIQEPVALCGLSMGGYIAFAFYRKYRHRLRGLILTATRAAADSPEASAARIQTAQMVQEKGTAPLFQNMATRLLSPETYAQQTDLLAELGAIMAGVSIEAVLGDLEGLRQRPDSTPLLGGIHLPVLIIHGAQDSIVPLAEAKAMHAAIPRAQLVVLHHSGHLPNLEQPEDFNQAVRQFLNEI